MLIRRDIRDLARRDKLEHLPRLLTMLAHMSGQSCNFPQLGGQIGLDHKTVGKYLAVFEQMFLMQRVPVWSSSRLGRLIETPKLQFIDSGPLCLRHPPLRRRHDPALRARPMGRTPRHPVARAIQVGRRAASADCS